MTVVAWINVEACPFSGFSNLNCHLEDTGIGFLVALCCQTVRRRLLEVSAKWPLH